MEITRNICPCLVSSCEHPSHGEKVLKYIFDKLIFLLASVPVCLFVFKRLKAKQICPFGPKYSMDKSVISKPLWYHRFITISNSVSIIIANVLTKGVHRSFLQLWLWILNVWKSRRKVGGIVLHQFCYNFFQIDLVCSRFWQPFAKSRPHV